MLFSVLLVSIKELMIHCMTRRPSIDRSIRKFPFANCLFDNFCLNMVESLSVGFFSKCDKIKLFESGSLWAWVPIPFAVIFLYSRLVRLMILMSYVHS